MDEEEQRLRYAGLQNAQTILSARRRAEDELLQSLRRAEERTNYALTAAHMAVWELDLLTGQVSSSQTMAALFGLAAGQEAKSLEAGFSMVHHDDRRMVEDSVARAAVEGTDLQLEFRATWPTGDIHWMAVRGCLLRDEAGRPARMLGIVTDISERKSLESQLRQAQKLEAVGLLAGGIAHDFNNILSVILSCSEFLLDEVGRDSPLRIDVEEIQKAGRRAANLTKQILAFSRQQVLAPKILDLNEVLAIASQMLERVLGEDIEFETRLAPDLERVKADPGQIEQVLMNLVVNARDAMPQGGKLTIQTSNVDVADADGHLGVPSGCYVRIAVGDTGVGMTRATQARIFEPFFTTKDRGKGTGLGLATVFGIVQQSGGSIRVDTELDVGTTFEVYLPRTQGKTSWPVPPSLRPAEARGTETILLVEDEDQVRAVASAILKKAGYRVLEATGP
jgi:two-component system, cell cycle sensor histidine kinase and response regulator CckA